MVNSLVFDLAVKDAAERIYLVYIQNPSRLWGAVPNLESAFAPRWARTKSQHGGLQHQWQQHIQNTRQRDLLLYISCSATRRGCPKTYSCKKSTWCKAAEKAVFVCSNEATGEEERQSMVPMTNQRLRGGGAAVRFGICIATHCITEISSLLLRSPKTYPPVLPSRHR